MILVDTSVWIDHLHRSDPVLVGLLETEMVGCHPYVIEELALGSITRRDTVLALLENLYQFPVLGHAETMTHIDVRRLWGQGLSAVDAHLLGAVRMVDGALLWTRDRRLRTAASGRAVTYD